MTATLGRVDRASRQQIERWFASRGFPLFVRAEHIGPLADYLALGLLALLLLESSALSFQHGQSALLRAVVMFASPVAFVALFFLTLQYQGRRDWPLVLVCV